MSTTRAMTAAAVVATQGLEGYAVCQCVELVLGARVRQVPASNPARADAVLSWVAEGGVTFQTSIDDGRTWKTVAASGDVIPQLTIGMSVTNLTLLIRQRFVAGSPNGRVTSVTATVVLDDGTTITRTETGGTLAQGTFFAATFDGTAVKPEAQAFVELRGTGSARRTIVPHGAAADALPMAEIAEWHRPEDLPGFGIVPGTPIAEWRDASGNGRHAWQPTAANQPTLDTTTGLNGFVCARFDGTSVAKYLFVPNYLKDLAEAEIFIVCSLDADPAGSEPLTGFWNFGPTTTGATHMPYLDSVIYDAFGTTARKTVGNPSLSLTTPRLYNVASKAGEWTARLNGSTLFTTGTNTVGFGTACKIGAVFVADTTGGIDLRAVMRVWEIIICKRVQSSGNRAWIQDYLTRKYQLPIQTTTAPTGPTVPQDLHVSHGTSNIYTLPGLPVSQTESTRVELEFELGDDDDAASAKTKQALADAAMAIELQFWVAPDAPATPMVVCGWADELFGTRPGWMLTLQPSTNGYYVRIDVQQHGYKDGAKIFQFFVRTGDDTIHRGRWYHLAWSYDGLWSTLFLNGAIVGQLAMRSRIGGTGNRDLVMGIVVPTRGAFVIGAQPATGTDLFVGRWNELRIWSRRITPGEVHARMRRQLSTADVTLLAADGLRAYYRGITPGATIADLSGNALHLDIVGQIAWGADTDSWLGMVETAQPDISQPVTYAPGRVSPGLLLDVDSNVLRLTNAPLDITFADGRTFIGAGTFGQVSATQEAGDLQPTGMTLALSGLPPSIVSLALGVDYSGRRCTVYHTQFDANGALVDAPWVLFRGLLDTLSVSVSDTASVGVAVESYLRNWDRPANVRWNHQAQQSRYPDDFGFELLAATADKEVWWPAKVSQEDDLPDSDAQGDVPTP